MIAEVGKGVATIILVLMGFGSHAWAQSTSDSNAAAVNDALSILEEHDAKREASPEYQRRRAFLYPTPRETLGKADYQQFLRSGGGLNGIDVRKALTLPPDRLPYFEGSHEIIYHPFVDRRVVAFDEGVYAIPGEAAYIGNFTYFPQRDIGSGELVRSVSIRGSYVIVGKKLNWHGQLENGIFIAENVISGWNLDPLKATPAFLKGFEQRHAQAVARQKRRLAEANSGGGSGFGAMLSLGLGAALIGGSNLSHLDKMDLAETFLTDVTSGGNGMAVFDDAMSRMGVSAGGTGVFSGNQVFETPGLNQAMDGMLNAITQQ